MKAAMIAGATGLVGSNLVRILIEDASYQKIKLLLRREIDVNHPKIEQIIIDFDNFSSALVNADEFYCCLGTTIRQAGSQEAFRKVDFDYPLKLAQAAHQNGISSYAIVTAVGSDTKSRFFYNRVKGEVEQAIMKIPFAKTLIFRPSLLLGKREETRAGEEVAKVFMKTLGFLMSKKIKGIHASQVAFAMVHAMNEAKEGLSIIESDMMQVFPVLKI